jgi:hypothetical protein
MHSLVELGIAIQHADSLDELLDDGARRDRLQHDHGLDVGELLRVLGPGNGRRVSAQTHRE